MIIRRKGGRGSGPLIVTIAIQVAVFIPSMIWIVALVMQVAAAAVASSDTSAALESNVEPESRGGRLGGRDLPHPRRLPPPAYGSDAQEVTAVAPRMCF